MKELCIVGSGNMGKAIASGILEKGLLKPQELVITDLRENQFREFCEKTGISGTCDNAAAVRESRTVILAVKPQYLADAVDTFRDQVAKDTLVVSIAAGRTLAELAALFPARTRLVRVMPNVAAMVLESMSAVSANEYVTREELQRVMDMFNSFGKAEEVPESMMDAVVGVSGSSPAYVCMLVEAMAGDKNQIVVDPNGKPGDDVIAGNVGDGGASENVAVSGDPADLTDFDELFDFLQKYIQ